MTDRKTELTREAIAHWREALPKIVETHALLILAANKMIQANGYVNQPLKAAIDMIKLPENTENGEVIRSIIDAINSDRADDNQASYDTAYPHEWAVYASKLTGEPVRGIFYLYDSDYSGPFAYTMDGLRTLWTIHADQVKQESA